MCRRRRFLTRGEKVRTVSANAIPRPVKRATVKARAWDVHQCPAEEAAHRHKRNTQAHQSDNPAPRFTRHGELQQVWMEVSDSI